MTLDSRHRSAGNPSVATRRRFPGRPDATRLLAAIRKIPWTVALAGWVVASPCWVNGSSPPNIIVIMADDLGWMDLRVQGNTTLDTPNIDRLAAEGMRFTDAYAAAPVCSPTRAAMMTGLSPARLGITNHAPGHAPGFVPKGRRHAGANKQTYLPLAHITIAERLKSAGYATGFIGKWHLSHRSRNASDAPSETDLRPEHQGFDLNIGGHRGGGPPSYFEPYGIPTIPPARDGDYLPDRLARESIRFIERNRRGPFFLCWWPYSVHYPFEAPQSLIDKYEERKGPGLRNPVYAAMIEGMDRAVGKVLSALDEMNLSNETFLLFTSDNGAFAADIRPLRGEKGYLWEGGIRVPWIVRWPGRVQEGAVSHAPVITMDVYPTLLEVAGLKPEKDLDGESLTPILLQSGTLARDAVYFHYPNYAFHKKNRLGGAVRQGAFKLIQWYDDQSVELYNLADDIGEARNLAARMPDKAARLRSKLEAWLKASNARFPAPTTPQ